MKSRSETALTLLEVMAAVALLGILYAYLAKAASQGILTTGDSRWRLEASLLLDEEFAALERQLGDGAPIDVGSTEEERDLFTIERISEPLALPLELLEEPAEGSALSLLSGANTVEEPGLLRRVTLRVSWFDGIHDQFLERTTFAVDISSLPLPTGTLPAGTLPPGGLRPPGELSN